MRTFGPTPALLTQASFVVSMLSAGAYYVEASFSGENVYAPSTAQAALTARARPFSTMLRRSKDRPLLK